MALHFLQGSKELMTNTNLFLTPRSKLKRRGTKYTQVHGRNTKIDAPDPIRAASTPRRALSLPQKHTLSEGGVARTLEVQRLRLTGERVRGFAPRVKRFRRDDGTKQSSPWQGVSLHSPRYARGEEGHLPCWCSVAQRLYIYNTFISSDL